jgi:hypothetical protein
MKRQWPTVLALSALAFLPNQSHGQFVPVEAPIPVSGPIPVNGGASYGGAGMGLVYLFLYTPVGPFLIVLAAVSLVVGLLVRLCSSAQGGAQATDSPFPGPSPRFEKVRVTRRLYGGPAASPSPSAAPVPPTRIRIVARPPGEAPAHIRAAWVGLELPLMDGWIGPRTCYAAGVLSGKRAAIVVGYLVNGKAAIELLAVHAPDAAAWWRTNAPHVLHDGCPLIFPADVCQTAS